MNDFELLSDLKRKCESQAEHIDQLRSTLDGLSGIRYDKDAVQTSMNGDPMLNKICKIEDEEQILTDLILNYARHRTSVVMRINRMEVGKRQHLLRMYYLGEKDLEACAAEFNWTFAYTRKELRKAVKDYENVP